MIGVFSHGCCVGDLGGLQDDTWLLMLQNKAHPVQELSCNADDCLVLGHASRERVEVQSQTLVVADSNPSSFGQDPSQITVLAFGHPGQRAIVSRGPFSGDQTDEEPLS